MKKAKNAFAKKPAATGKVIGSFVDSTTGNEKNEKKRIQSSSDDSFKSYPLSKKTKSDVEAVPNLERTAQSTIIASLQKPSLPSSTLEEQPYLKPIPTNFFDIAPSDYDVKTLQEGYKELTKSSSVIKDKGFAKIVNSSVIKKKSEKKEAKPQQQLEKNIEQLEEETNERDESEEMKRQVEDFLKIEELKKKQSELIGSGKSLAKSPNNTTQQESDSESSDDEDDLLINWKSRGSKK